MALELLFFIMFNLSYEARAKALPQPKVEVDRLLITETDSVTLNCSTSHVNVDQCVFYIENKEMSAPSSCVETLTGSELLRMTEKILPAEVKVKCFYTVKNGALNVTSSDSESTIISINNLVPPTLTVNSLVITETDSVTLDCQPPSSVPVTECYFFIGGGSQLQRFNCQKTLKGGEILYLTKQRSPANFDVTCFYLVGHRSPISNLLTIIIQIPPPELTVNPQLITETDSVTLNCGTPSSVSVDKCFLYFITSKINKIISCEQIMSGRELLMMTFQTSPAEVQLTCYYTVKKTDGGQHQSPYSNIQSVINNKAKELDSTTSSRVSTFSVTAGQTSDTTTKETDMLFTPSPATDGTTDQIFDRTTMKTDGFISLSPASVKPTLGGTTDDRFLGKSLLTELKSLRAWFLVPPGVGVGVGILLIVGLLCSRRRSAKFTNRRSRLIYNDNVIGMNSRPSRELLPVSDEDGYHMITSIPPADSATEPIGVNTQHSQNENIDVYHVYSTITDEPAESTEESPMYCSLQAH